MSIVNTKKYKTSLINNRRYLGNKYKLLPFITRVVKEKCKEFTTFADIFAGTGAVSSAFMDKIIITNDLMYSNYISNYAWFSAEKYNFDKIVEYITNYNSKTNCGDNYMTQNFADTYFSKIDCSKIGYIRNDIEEKYILGKLNKREKALLITSLLYAMDKIAVTCGHYDAYRKNAKFEHSLELYVPLAKKNNNLQNQCFNEDANNLVKRITADIVYIDPPYNSRQYCDAYHILENVACWKKPEVFGIARKMDRSFMKSQYCTLKATSAFEDLVRNIKAKYILLSYNNMAKKGNSRSNAKIADTDIIKILNTKGTVEIFEENYKAFTTGKSNLSDNVERLFLCKCF